jgi:hypothetical protein
VLGRLTWDEQFSSWTGGVDLNPDFHTAISIWGPKEDRLQHFPVARESLLWLRVHEPEARSQVAAEMVELYNDSWTDEEKPITTQEFADRIALMRASLGEDGSLLLSYDDGEMAMFGRHVLDASFGPNKDYQGIFLI